MCMSLMFLITPEILLSIDVDIASVMVTSNKDKTSAYR